MTNPSIRLQKKKAGSGEASGKSFSGEDDRKVTSVSHAKPLVVAAIREGKEICVVMFERQT